MKAFWNQRYSAPEFAYGEAPNVFLKTQIDQLPVGKILFPAEGEGRNAVYAAKLGWEVAAFDMSEAGQQKALMLAEKNAVEIDYILNSFDNLPYQGEQFDAIGLIYAHFPAPLKSDFYKQLSAYLKPGGKVIFEAFSKKQLAYNSVNPKAGGPKNVDMLFSEEELRLDFEDFDFLLLEEKEVFLQEGLYHNGKSAVIRFVGQKK